MRPETLQVAARVAERCVTLRCVALQPAAKRARSPFDRMASPSPRHLFCYMLDTLVHTCFERSQRGKKESEKEKEKETYVHDVI